MLANVFTRTVQERWRGVLIGSLSMGLMLFFGMTVYREIDLSVYGEMPEALRAIMNIGEDVDASGLAYGAIYSSYGALVLASLALSMGAAAIAGEERNGTIGLLLGNPVSRTTTVLSKAASLVVVTAFGAAVLWGAGELVPVMLDVDVSQMHVAALCLHMFAISLFFGLTALALGAISGNRGLASGASAGLMVFSFFAVGLLPLVEGWEGLTRLFPWHYYDQSQPVYNGVDWGHLGILLGLGVGLLVVAVVGLERRDLRERSVATTWLDRLRTHRVTRRVVERIAGSARVSRIAAKAVSDHQTMTIVVGYVLLLVGIMMGPFFSLIAEDMAGFADQFPEALMAMIGYADISTPEGWYLTENFSLTIPISLLVVTTVVGSKALAGEEANRTMGLLLANPVSRRAVVLEKTSALVVISAVLGVLVFGGTMIGSLVAGLGMSAVAVAGTTLLAALLGLVFGALALAIGAATGRVRAAAFGTAGSALVLYIVHVFLPLNDSVAAVARVSPFYYYLEGDPLTNGMAWTHATVLAAAFVALVASSVVLFERRDLRQTD